MALYAWERAHEVSMSRPPIVGIIGNSYLLNDQYPTHAGGAR